MPLGSVAEGVLQLIGRVVFEIFGNLILEVAIKGVGYLLTRHVINFGRKRDVDPESFLCGAVGVGFWCLVGTAIYYWVNR